MESWSQFEHEDEEDLIEDTYLTFNLAADKYGLCVQAVSEVCVIETITPVPDVPPFLKGVINLRGQIVPIIDLRLRLGLSEAQDARQVTIIMEQEESFVGLIVDKVTGVQLIPPQKIKAPLMQGAEERVGLVEGMCKVDEVVHVLLSPKRLLDDSCQAVQRQEVSS